QVATPRELYESPVNLFVAGFIGSPSMNFIPANVTDEGLQTPFGTVQLPDDRMGDMNGHEFVVIGARPEHFEDAEVVDDALRDHGTTFDVTVDVLEWLGSEQFAYVPYEAPDEVAAHLDELAKELEAEELHTQLIVSLDVTSRLAEGETATLWLDLRKVQLFDPKTGDNLTLAGDRHRAPEPRGTNGG